MRAVLAGLAMLGLVAGCQSVTTTTVNPPIPANTAANALIGKVYWASDRSVYVCKGPVLDLALTGALPCGPYQNGSFVIEGVETLGPNMSYRVKLGDGRQGYIKSMDLLHADDEAAHAVKAKEKADCDRRGGVRVGMTLAQVHASCWGKPQRVNTTTTAGGNHDQLVYPGNYYVYLRNGVVTSIQTSTR